MRYVISFFAPIFFIGCNGIPTASNWANDWIGEDINRIYVMNKRNVEHSGDEYVYYWRKNNINKDYYLKNGNLIHVHPIRRDCLIHWEVDKNTNKIIGYKFEGNRCY